jgi:hypothetical protein
MMSEPEWTADDQRRADGFTRQIVDVAAHLRGGHPDVVIVAFVQTTGNLIRERLRADPSRAPVYAQMLDRLMTHVGLAMPPTDDEQTH